MVRNCHLSSINKKADIMPATTIFVLLPTLFCLRSALHSCVGRLVSAYPSQEANSELSSRSAIALFTRTGRSRITMPSRRFANCFTSATGSLDYIRLAIVPLPICSSMPERCRGRRFRHRRWINFSSWKRRSRKSVFGERQGVSRLPA